MQTPTIKQNLILDCDPGGDDAIAMLLAIKHANLCGVTTVSGNAPLADTTRNALSLLEAVGADIPVHSGASRPLACEPVHAEQVHGKGGFGDVELPQPTRQVSSEDAVGYLLDSSRAIDKLWVVAVGPLTNIAMAIERDAGWVNRIAGLSIMGGSTDSGNITPTAEFNIWADPEAARIVFNSGAAIKLCGLNLTRQLQTDDEILKRLAGRGAIAQLFADLFAALHTRLSVLTGERRAALHDPCSVIALTHPELIGFDRLPVDIELDGELTRGMTVVDQRSSPMPVSSSVEVGMSIDSDRAMQLVIDTMSSYQ